MVVPSEADPLVEVPLAEYHPVQEASSLVLCRLVHKGLLPSVRKGSSILVVLADEGILPKQAGVSYT